MLAGTFTTSPAGLLAPEWISPVDPLADDLRSLALLGLLPTRFAEQRPVLRGDAARALASADGSRAPGAPRHPLWVRSAQTLAGELADVPGAPTYPETPPWAEFRGEAAAVRLRPYVDLGGAWAQGGRSEWADGARAGVAGIARFGDAVSLHQDLAVGHVPGGRTFADALVAHTDLLVFVESAYLGYSRPGVSARLGRTRRQWGPARGGNLFVDRSAAPFDHLEFTVPLGAFHFMAATGVLSIPQGRNIALHRLEWSPSERFTLGWSEGAVFTGSPFQPLYALGIVPYTLVERLAGQDAGAVGVPAVRNNVLWTIDAFYRPARGSWVWGAMLIDDVATESKEMPSRLGFQLGGGAALAAERRWWAEVEATKVYDYTYSVNYGDACACDWKHQDRPLGFPTGPDSEELLLTLHAAPSVPFSFELGGRVTRRGEGRLGDPWNAPELPAVEKRGPAWRLRGVIERRVETRIGARWSPRENFSALGTVRLGRVRNGENASGRRQSESSLELRLLSHW